MLFVSSDAFEVPTQGGPQLDRTVDSNFERFDGLGPMDSSQAGVRGYTYFPEGPRPGQSGSELTEQVYTPGPLNGLTNTLGGQPYIAADWKWRSIAGYTPANYAQTMQYRFGQGTNSQGADQTTYLAGITNNPPQPDDLESIIGAFG